MLLALSLLASVAHAGFDDLGFEQEGASPLIPIDVDRIPSPERPDADPVVGGDIAAEGRWPDAAGVVFDGQYVGCTGTLVAPDVVLTAAHCVGGISHVILNTTNWILVEEGEVIEVAQEVAHPGGHDIAVLVLARDARTPFRTIAQDCVVDDHLQDGVDVVIVGYGATRSNGGGNTTRLHEGTTLVQTSDCSKSSINGVRTGCDSRLKEAAEIGAGGKSVDACFGDSGGPLYLPTSDGTFLVGVTSRSYIGVPRDEPCKFGGIYVRPDTVIAWIERTVGHPMPYPDTCNASPTVTAEPLAVPSGGSDEVVLSVEDPDGEAYDVVVAVEPEHGEVTLKNGVATYAAANGYSGPDSFTLTVLDDGSVDYPNAPSKAVDVVVPVEVIACGCATGSAPLGLWALGLGAVLLRRRNRI